VDVRRPLLPAALLLLATGCGGEQEAAGGAAAPSLAAAEPPASFGFGRPATEADIAAWDIDVRPDGAGLPPGSGSVQLGREVYAAKCAACHGATGTEGPNDVLVGRVPGDSFPFGNDPALRKTIGNYWPYASTLYDYVHRAMPYDSPGSLTPGETYSVVAYLLHRNELLPADATLDARSLPQVRMPARDRFVADDRRGGPEVR
jgi:S-disulfanyl-L-cysteine oxidoreductase SoxD